MSRNPPTLRNLKKEEKISDAYTKLFIKSFSDIYELEILKVLGNDYECRKFSDYIVFYKIKINEIGIPNMSVMYPNWWQNPRHFEHCNNCSVPLLPWFRNGTMLPAPSIVFRSLKSFTLIWKIWKKNILHHLLLRDFKVSKTSSYSSKNFRFSLKTPYTSLFKHTN